MLQEAPGASNQHSTSYRAGWLAGRRSEYQVSDRHDTDANRRLLYNFQETSLAFSQLGVLVAQVRHQGGPCEISRAVVFGRRVLSSKLRTQPWRGKLSLAKSRPSC